MNNVGLCLSWPSGEAKSITHLNTVIVYDDDDDDDDDVHSHVTLTVVHVCPVRQVWPRANTHLNTVTV